MNENKKITYETSGRLLKEFLNYNIGIYYSYKCLYYKRRWEIRDFIFNLKKLEEELTEYQLNRRKERIKTRANVNEQITEKQHENTNKIDKTLARLIKKKWKNIQIANTRNQRGDIATDSKDIKKIRGY